jgi:hypothetical protein
VIAALQLTSEGGVHCRHPAGDRNANLCAFKRGKSGFEQADGRVAVARIDVAFIFAFEAGFSLLGGLIDIARGQV